MDNNSTFTSTTDNADFNMVHCDKNSCMACSSRICMDNFVINHVTSEKFPLTFNGSCNTKNCVYVIKCTHADCNYQYVGHTINTIKARISQHKSTIIRGGGCRVLREHFTEVHSTNNLSIMPIALLPENSSLKALKKGKISKITGCSNSIPYFPMV